MKKYQPEGGYETIKPDMDVLKGVEVIKIVTMAKSINDGSRILSLYNNSNNVRLVAFSMGSFGRMNI